MNAKVAEVPSTLKVAFTSGRRGGVQDFMGLVREDFKRGGKQGSLS